MKNVFKIAAVFSFVLTLSAPGQSFANHNVDTKDFFIMSSAVSTPVGFIFCTKGYDPVKDCLGVSSYNAVSTTTTALLLKDIEAAQPDALNYIAGGAPSPTLYSVVEKLQEFSKENLGKELSFDEVVDDIIDHM